MVMVQFRSPEDFPVVMLVWKLCHVPLLLVANVTVSVWLVFVSVTFIPTAVLSLMFVLSLPGFCLSVVGHVFVQFR